ncbi:unnamed protein product [Dibothriocephalus latus]|uniref:Uncharacterized protein n=1 Tax=Dibothriocephalus latus TaxID=60516 RepID=A0A3P6T7X3_DIBLA|nr:unnamed protein product [Dibothriocephalus latus]
MLKACVGDKQSVRISAMQHLFTIVGLRAKPKTTNEMTEASPDPVWSFQLLASISRSRTVASPAASLETAMLTVSAHLVSGLLLLCCLQAAFAVPKTIQGVSDVRRKKTDWSMTNTPHQKIHLDPDTRLDLSSTIDAEAEKEAYNRCGMAVTDGNIGAHIDNPLISVNLEATESQEWSKVNRIILINLHRLLALVELADCSYDYLELFDGPPDPSFLIHKLWWPRIPAAIASTSKRLIGKLVAESWTNEIRFMASFKKVLYEELDECITDDPGCEHTCVGYTNGYKCQYDEKFELLLDGKSCQ